MKKNKLFYIHRSLCICCSRKKERRRRFYSVTILGISFETPAFCKGCESPLEYCSFTRKLGGLISWPLKNHKI